MKVTALALAALLSFPTLTELWQRLTKDPVAAAANHKGVSSFEKKDYKTATGSFEKQAKLRPSPVTAFNVGTARVAAGKNEDGSAALAEAMKNPALRADALYNRGNGALAAGSYDRAVRDYSDVLRLRPDDHEAKRNLEIALQRNEAKQRNENGGGKPQQGKPEQPASGGQKPSGAKPSPQAAPPTRPDTDADALLRSVQQQEKEELSRMRQQHPTPRRVGW